MKYALRVLVGLSILILMILIPLSGNNWVVDRNSSKTYSLGEAEAAFPATLKEIKGETFRNGDSTHVYRTYGKKGMITIRNYPSADLAKKALISTSTDANGTVRSSINGEILSQGIVRVSRKPSIDGFYSTRDTRRTGFYWLSGNTVYSVEANNRVNLERLALSYKPLHLKFNLSRLILSAFRSLGWWVIPLLIVVLVPVSLFLLASGFLGLFSLTGCRSGSGKNPFSESELSTEIEKTATSNPLAISEHSRYDYRVDKAPDPQQLSDIAIKTRSGYLTLDPMKRTVFFRESPVSLIKHNDGVKIRARFTLLPVVPQAPNRTDEAGVSISSILQPVVLDAGWKWRPEPSIPTTGAILKKMSAPREEK